MRTFWIVYCCSFDSTWSFLFQPVVDTLLHGVMTSTLDWNVTSYLLQKTSRIEIVKELTNRVSSYDVVVCVGNIIHHEFPYDFLKKQNVYTVFYQTEPIHHCPHSNADEMWQFSWHNIDACKNKVNIQRYVPLGYVPRKMSFMHTRNISHLNFLGNIKYRRKDCLEYIQSHVKGELNIMSNVWSARTFQKMLETEEVFLNIHKSMKNKNWNDSCDDAHNPVTFRVPLLLNTGALIISQKSYKADENQYKDMVSFVAFEDIGKEYNYFKSLSVSERQVLATRRHALFAKTFMPSKIFNESGVTNLLHNLTIQKNELNVRQKFFLTKI